MNNVVINPYEYFADPTKGRPIFNGFVYIGQPDTDPEVPANQKQVYARQEDGNDVAIPQPVLTNAGGYPTYNGSVVIITVQGPYSVKVNDKQGNQLLYQAVVSSSDATVTATPSGVSKTLGEWTEYLATPETIEVTADGTTTPRTLGDWTEKEVLSYSSIAEAKVDTKLEAGRRTKTYGYYSVGDGGGAEYVVVAGGTGTDDGGSYHDTANGLQLKLVSDKLSFRLFGCTGDGVTDETAKVQSTINYSSASGLPIVDNFGSYAVTVIAWPDNVQILGSLVWSSKIVKIGVATDPILTYASPITKVKIKGFDILGAFTLGISPTANKYDIDIGGEAECENVNSSFHTWRRSDARGIDVFNGVNPTFGDPATYDGTGGLKVYHADAWYTQIYGNQGAAVITKTLNTGDERKQVISEYHLNYNVSSVTPPPAKFNTTVTAATTYNASSMTLTIGSHSLIVGDYIWWDGAEYTGGTFTESTFQITSTTSTTITFAITPDVGFSAWVSFGRVTDDPDNTGYEHIHDPSLGTIRRSWIRNGTSGIDLGCRVPLSRLSGYHTVRVKARLNSGHNGWFPRIFQNFGQSGSANTSTTFPAIIMQEGTSDIQEFIVHAKLPDISAKTFNKGSYTQFNFVPTIYDPTADIDLFEFSVFEGLNVPQYSDSSFNKESDVFKRLYRVDRSQIIAPVTLGRFYGINTSYDEPMFGPPDVTLLNEITASSMSFDSMSYSSKYGYGLSITATATVNVGQYLAIWESEYKIPTGYVGA